MLPQTAPDGSELIYSIGGLAFYREPNDSNNPTLYFAARIGSGHILNQLVHQFRISNISNPASPTLTSSYTEITALKSYSYQIYENSSVIKRYTRYAGDISYSTISSGPDYYGIFHDKIDNLLYWTYTGTYNDPPSGPDLDSKSFGYSSMNYNTSSGVGHGPWGITGVYAKTIGGGMVDIPSWYADAYLGGKRLAVGVGGYGSKVGQGTSMGPALIAIDPPTSATEDTFLSGVDLIRYAAGNGAQTHYATRPAYTAQLTEPGAPYTDRWTWFDTMRGAVWIDTGTKHGVLFTATLGIGTIGYLGSTISASAGRNYWIIADPMSFAPVTSGNAYDASLTYIEKDYQFDDPLGVPKSVLSLGSITSSTSTAGGSRHVFGNNVITIPGHGLSFNGSYLYWSDGRRVAGIYIAGNSNSEYNGGWSVEIIDANNITVKAGNDITDWSGTSGSGGTAEALTATGDSLSFNQHLGCAYDSVAKRLYVAVNRGGFGAVGGVRVFIDVYDVA